MRKIIIFVAIVIATITTVSCDFANFTTISVNFDNSSDGENVVNDNVEVPEEESEIIKTVEETTTIPVTETGISVGNENETEAETEAATTETEIQTTTETEIQTTETEIQTTETPEVLLKNVNEVNETWNDHFLKENSTSAHFPTIIINTTGKNATVPPPSQNYTTIKTTTDRVKPDDKKPSLLSSFNLNYLYLLLLIIPIAGIVIFIYWYCKKKRKSAGYIEPRAQKTKRLSTPSWVFSEPDFQDEEITTLEEEKRL